MDDKTPETKHSVSKPFLLLPLCAVIFFISPFFGASPTSFPPSPDEWEIIRELRLPRIILAFIIGGGLSMVGAILQSFFKNDLASPYTLGVSSAAALGAAIAIFFRMPALFLQLFSITGALTALVFLLFFFRSQRFENISSLLLIGLALGLISSSGIFLLQYLGGAERSFEMYRWLTGGLEIVGYEVLLLPTAVFIVCYIFISKNLYSLDVLQVGLQFAKGRGVQVQKVGRQLITISSIMIGIFVSICGPIGFVGLVMPHIARKLVGGSHYILIPYSIILGGTFLAFTDILSRSLFSPIEIPVGIFTSLIGGPWFLYLLLRRRR